MPPGWCAEALETAPPLPGPQDAPTTAVAGLLVPSGWCVWALKTIAPLAGPPRRTDHRRGRTPRPPRLVCPGFGGCSPPRRPFGTRRPPPGHNSLRPQANVSTLWRLQPPCQALQDAPTNAWAGLRVPPGWSAQALDTAAPLPGPSRRTDNRLGRTPHSPRLMCPGFGDCSPLHRPFMTRRPPPGLDSPSPRAGVPKLWRLQPPSQAPQDAPTAA